MDFGRIAAIAALVLVVLALLYLFLFSGGDGHTYRLTMETGGQLVKGNQVLIGGVPGAAFERLTSTGAITGFTATVDPAAIGLGTSAYITLTVRQNSWRDLKARLQAIPEVHHMALVGGEFDVILLVRAADNAALRNVVLNELQAIPGVLATRTALVFEDAENVGATARPAGNPEA